MKLFRLITHPLTLTLSFCFLLISGEEWGGFYLQYILMAIPHGMGYAIAALAGGLMLVAGGRLQSAGYRLLRNYKVRPGAVFNLLGLGCYVLSLFLFFAGDKKGYNRGSFEQALPLLLFYFFELIAFLFLLRNSMNLVRRRLPGPVH